MYWLIKKKSDESTVYVSAFPDIMFTSDRKRALKMDKLTAMDAIHILMNMTTENAFHVIKTLDNLPKRFGIF